MSVFIDLSIIDSRCFDLQMRELWVFLLGNPQLSLELTHTYRHQVTARELNCSLSGKDPFDDANR